MAYNPTFAKEVALTFLEKIGQRPNPSAMARTIKSVKELMEFGYTEEEISYAMEYTLRVKKDVYSFGYIASSIDTALKLRTKREAPKHAVQLRDIVVTAESEVEMSEQLAERNKRKATRIGLQSRKREKYNFDMLKGE